MEFVCYHDLAALPAGADTLFAGSAQRSLFLSRPWFENLAATAAQDPAGLRLAGVLEGGRLLALLPLLAGPDGVWRAWRHRYTTHYSLLLADGDPTAVLRCLVQGLQGLRLRALLLEPVGDWDPAINALRQALVAAGFVCETRFRFYNWVLRPGGQSYAEYLAARPPRLRNTLARRQRRLQREQDYRLQLHVGDQVPAAMVDYHAVYRASWKASEQYAGLLDGLVGLSAAPGWPRLGVLTIQGRPVAAQLWFVVGGRASIFRLAHDQAWQRYSPGSLLTAWMLRRMLDVERVVEVDFLTGNEPYKQDWMGQRRECLVLSCLAPPAPGPIAGLWARLGRFGPGR